MDEILYLKKHRLNSEYRNLFRFKKKNVKWLATVFAGEENQEYFSSIQKMKLCLKYLGSPASDKEIDDKDYDVDKAVSRTITTVISNIVAGADKWIKFPQSVASIMKAKDDWRSKNRFPTAIGVIDCTHFRIKKSEYYSDEYINRNGVNSLNVQATCDANEMFTSVDTRWPGSVDDSRIWKNSVIRHIMALRRKTVLLADEAYVTEPWLMTPFVDPRRIAQVSFNNILKLEREIIDRCFGQVRRRFPILQCVSCLKHETASDIVTACFVLHNVAKYLKEEDFEEELCNKSAADKVNEDKIRQRGCEVRDSWTQVDLPETSDQMMSNTSSTAYANSLQQHNLTATIDYLNQNGSTTLATYPSVATQENGIIMEKQPTAPYYVATPNPATFYSTELVAQPSGTILITSNFGSDDSSTISGVNNNFNNSSIRIVTHNNNNNTNHTNNNNTKLECEINSDKQPQQQQQHYHHHHLHHQQPPVVLQHPPSTLSPNSIKMPNSQAATPASGPTNTSTVVLDRINICINNHFGDTTSLPQSAAPQPPSGSVEPITPMIHNQHTKIVDVKAPCVPPPTTKLVDTSNLDMHVDEPDSTTSTPCHDLIPTEIDLQIQEEEKCLIFDLFAMQKFEIGEDALVKRRDGRYYLGTVVDIHRQQYLVQFDDKTDYWSNVDELMKLSTDVLSKENPTCLSCKRENDDDVVEICERCGRGYHRQCTDEVSPKSGLWMCKRCEKPMKYSLEDEADEKLLRLKKRSRSERKKVIKQFPYALDSLQWDEKHRVNLEQIYCYCGKSGQFDNNMIQCCKCKQWFHAHCVECVKTLFRGDVFFMFGCSVCNNGKEFLRRIEMDWVDLAHLVLYNMAIMKNFQKYHHLYKEIYPFALEKRTAFQLPKTILNLSDFEFKEKLLKTLQAHPKLFQCGKEIKKDHAFWGLRANKPPQGPTYDVQRHEVLCNQLIREKLKIKILPNTEEEEEEDVYEEEEESPKESIGDGPKQTAPSPPPPPPESPVTTAAQNLKFKPDLDDDDDDKFTSDDEIPIKLILEKEKISNSMLDLRETKPKIQDESGTSDQSNDHRTDEKEKKEKKEDTPVAKVSQKSSRKRKAFTLSKSYKDSDKSNDLPRSICDSSSDENSSSSRGTLDLIIPPPKDFLGDNNPFRIVTPKKSDNAVTASTKGSGNSCITKKTVSFGSNSIFTNTLDLNSKIAALKNSGLFPNISNSDIAKAAGQPRLVRTIKRRLSAKDIMIGPNQEVRRRRTKPLSSNVEVISTTTINQIPSNFFPIRATIPESTNTTNSSKSTKSSSQSNSPHITSSASSSLNCVPSATEPTTTYGRRLRKRPAKTSPENSRRNSMCSSSSSNSSTGAATLPPPSQPQNTVSMSDLKQSVNKYFGAANRIENGEKFTIRAKRRLNSGQMQYLIEWES